MQLMNIFHNIKENRKYIFQIKEKFKLLVTLEWDLKYVFKKYLKHYLLLLVIK